MPMKGKWAQGIQPRNFAWIMKDQLAVCERPGGYGANHRRVRRQEEIIWIREQGFTCVVTLIPSPHNLHNYDELGVAWRHLPVRRRTTTPTRWPPTLFPELADDAGRRRQGARAPGRAVRPRRRPDGGLPPVGGRRAARARRPPRWSSGCCRARWARSAATSSSMAADRHPLSAGGAATDVIELRGLRLAGDRRRAARGAAQAQPLELDLDLALDLAAAGRSDDLADTVDYGAAVRRSPSRWSTDGRFALLEALAERVAEAVLAADGRIEAVTVAVRKLRAAGGPAARHLRRPHHPDRVAPDRRAPRLPRPGLEPRRPRRPPPRRPSPRSPTWWPCRRCTRPTRSAGPSRARSSTSSSSSTPTSTPRGLLGVCRRLEAAADAGAARAVGPAHARRRRALGRRRGGRRARPAGAAPADVGAPLRARPARRPRPRPRRPRRSWPRAEGEVRRRSGSLEQVP